MFRRVNFECAKVHWIWDDPAIRGAVIQDMEERGHTAEPIDDTQPFHQPQPTSTYDAGGSIFLSIDKWVDLPAGTTTVSALDSHIPSMVYQMEHRSAARARPPGYIKLHGAYYVTVLTVEQAQGLLVSAKRWLAAQEPS